MDHNDKEIRLAKAEKRRQALALLVQERWGQAAFNLAVNKPTQRLNELYEQHKALCFKDVYTSIREATVEYAAKYWMLSAQYDRDADIHESIQARHMFILPDALYLLRAVEAEKGRRNIANLNAYFLPVKLQDLGTKPFALDAREFLEARFEARERLDNSLMELKHIDIRSSTESIEDWVSLTTRPILSLFHHDCGNRENKTSIYHSIRNYAMYAIAQPGKDKELEANMQAATQRLIERVPHLQNIQNFIQRLNSISGEGPSKQSKAAAENVYSLFGRNYSEP